MSNDTFLEKIKGTTTQLINISGGAVKILYNQVLGDVAASSNVLEFVKSMTAASKPSNKSTIDTSSTRPRLTLPSQDNLDIRLFSWKLSYFSGKIRAYLKYKSSVDGLRFQDVNASPSIIKSLLVPLTDTNTVPQIQIPDGSFVQDSTEIIDVVDRLFPKTVVLPNITDRPKQRMVCRLMELFGDEWLLVAAYHWRWAYSTNENKGQFMYNGDRALNKNTADKEKTDYLEPNHRKYNAVQWGDFMNSNATGKAQEQAGDLLFDAVMFRGGPKQGCINLGIQSDELAEAFEQSTLRFLSLFEKHLGETNCPFILGDRPSLADFGLLGPLYAHLYKDPVPGYIMRTRYPLVAEWCERVHDWNGIRFNRSMKYDKDTGTMIDDDKDRKLEWYPDDHVPPTVIAMLSCFFDEMWPVLVSASKVLTKYINDGQGPGINIGLPGKSFGASSSSQLNDGSLTHAFTIPVYDRMGTKGRRTRYASRPIKHLSGRRMVIPYQFWMLGRIADDVTVLNRNGKAKEITTFLNKCGNNNGGIEGFMNVDKMIAGCRIKKIGGKLFSVGPSSIGKSRL